MKKIIIVLFLFIVTAVITNEKKNILIPDNAIRFRVIANSNELYDQNLKMRIKEDVEGEIYKIIGESRHIDDARTKITNNMHKIDNILKRYNVNYDISYGNNYFPTKKYKGITYEAGKYESLVITLGEAVGDNWWCVLFPPLCLLDEKKDLDNAEYNLYVNKLINKFR